MEFGKNLGIFFGGGWCYFIGRKWVKVGVEVWLQGVREEI